MIELANIMMRSEVIEAIEAAVLAERERIFKEYGIDPKKNETNS